MTAPGPVVEREVIVLDPRAGIVVAICCVMRDTNGLWYINHGFLRLGG